MASLIPKRVPARIRASGSTPATVSSVLAARATPSMGLGGNVVTPAPAGSLFYDPFNQADGASPDAARWRLGKVPNVGGGVSVQGGKMRLATGTTGGYNNGADRASVVLTDPNPLADFDITFKTRLNGELYACGFFFRSNNDNEPYIGNGYQLTMNNNPISLEYLQNYSGQGVASMTGAVTVLDQSQEYNVRVRAVGTSLRVKIWPVGTSQPSTWGIDTTHTGKTDGGFTGFGTNGGGAAASQFLFVDDFTMMPTAEVVPPTVSGAVFASAAVGMSLGGVQTAVLTAQVLKAGTASMAVAGFRTQAGVWLGARGTPALTVDGRLTKSMALAVAAASSALWDGATAQVGTLAVSAATAVTISAAIDRVAAWQGRGVPAALFAADVSHPAALAARSTPALVVAAQRQAVAALVARGTPALAVAGTRIQLDSLLLNGLAAMNVEVLGASGGAWTATAGSALDVSPGAGTLPALLAAQAAAGAAIAGTRGQVGGLAMRATPAATWGALYGRLAAVVAQAVATMAVRPAAVAFLTVRGTPAAVIVGTRGQVAVLRVLATGRLALSPVVAVQRVDHRAMVVRLLSDGLHEGFVTPTEALSILSPSEAAATVSDGGMLATITE